MDILQKASAVVLTFGVSAFAGNASYWCVVISKEQSQQQREQFVPDLAASSDVFVLQQQKIDFQRAQMDKLGRKKSPSIEEIDRYRSGMENIRQQEDELKRQMENSHAADVMAGRI